MTRGFGFASFPSPLAAIMLRDKRGDLVIILAFGLSAEQRKTAIQMTRRRTKRAGWPGLMPVPLAWLLRRGRHAVPAAHAGVSAAAAAAVVGLAGAVVATTMALAPAHPAAPRVPLPAASTSPVPSARVTPARGRPASPTAPVPGPEASPAPGLVQGLLKGAGGTTRKAVAGVQKVATATRCTVRGALQRLIPGLQLPTLGPVPLPSPLPTLLPTLPCVAAAVTHSPSPKG